MRILAGFAAVLALAPTADASKVADVPANVAISAHGGWVLWSVRDGDGWKLMGRHAGVTSALPVGARPAPFDIDVGTAADGGLVATYSRCRRTPARHWNGLTRPWSGSGCRIWVLDLATGRERPAGEPRPGGTSNTAPSMWNGQLAYAQRDERNHPQVGQVMLWSPGHAHARRMTHGTAPTDSCGSRRPPDCARQDSGAQALDLGERMLAFLWLVDSQTIGGAPIHMEIRADWVNSDRTDVVAGGVVGESCFGGIDAIVLSAPSVDGGHVWFTDSRSACGKGHTTLRRRDVRGGSTRSQRLGRPAHQFARNGRSVYFLRGDGQPEGHACPCALERMAASAKLRG